MPGFVKSRGSGLRREHGSPDPAIGSILKDRLRSDVSVFAIPYGGQHVRHDQPLALVAMLRVVLPYLASRKDPDV